MAVVTRPRWALRAAASAVALALVATAVYLVLGSAFADPVPLEASAMAASSLGDRVLVVAPHPDDEIINPSGLIAQALAGGARVKVVQVTTGDGYAHAARYLVHGPATPAAMLELGRARHAENERALDQLGVPKADRIYLGYPDGSINSLWDHDWDPTSPHLGANGRTRIPYGFALRPGAVYCGSNLATDLVGIVRDFRPTTIVYPDALDHHHDHWGTAAFCDYAMEATGFTGRRIGYITHYALYPFPLSYLPSGYLHPPGPLREAGSGLSWTSVALPDRDEKAKDRQVDAFRTQLDVPHMRLHLLAFVRRNEIFCTYEPGNVADSSTDSVPRGGDDPGPGVMLQPSTQLTRFTEPLGSIRSVRVVRGPSKVWVGVRTWDGSPGRLSYRFGLRLFGDRERRIDVAVYRGKARSLMRSSSSIAPAGLHTVRAGETVWISFDRSVLDGYRTCLVEGSTSIPRSTNRPNRSAWRPISLAGGGF